MSRKYNAATRLLNAYGKYTEQLAKRTAIWAKKGYTPVDPTALSFEDFVANREYLKSRGIAAGNVTRTIISQQLYAFNQSQAEALIKELAGMGITSIKGKKLSLEAIKAGGGKDALSALNEALKAAGMESGYERAQYITEHIYEDSI